MSKFSKPLILIICLAFVGYAIFSIGSNRATADFKPYLDSLTKVNDSLAADNEQDSHKIAELQAQDSILTYKVEHQKAKIVKIKEIVEVEKNKIDNFTERELVSYLNQRYPKDTVTNPLPVAQPVLTLASKDLAAYDGAKLEIVVKDSIITVQQDKIVLKDSTIGLYQNKEGRYKTIIGNQDLKIAEWSKQYGNLYIEHNKMKLKNKFVRIGTGLIVGGLIYMTFSK
jgi:hypothetical protein